MKLLNGYKNITEKDIQDLCGELEVILPDSYAKFLLTNNGGQPEENHFSKKDIDGNIQFDFDLNAFYGIGGNDTGLDILTMFALNCERIPEELLPIGNDGIDNVICMGIEPEYLGKIYIWWKDGQVDEGDTPNFENIDLIENSFDDFLKGFNNL